MYSVCIRIKSDLSSRHQDELLAVNLAANQEISQAKEELEAAHKNEIESYQTALEEEKARVLALEAVQGSLQTAHKEIMEKAKDESDRQVENLQALMDAAHGNQVKELQDLIENQHKEVNKWMEKCLHTNY